MFRTMMLASVVVFGAAGAAMAQDGASSAIGNVVGGGVARVSGGGEDASVAYSARGATQAGRGAQISGGTGDGPEVQYLGPVPAGERGRSALLLGSGENATIVYSDALAAYHG